MRILPLVTVLCIALASTAGAATPSATASKACHMSLKQQRNAGATYLVSLEVKGVTCPTGLSVENAFQSCRKATAGHRTCQRKVSGYTCRQTILDSSKTQYDARVRCAGGSRSVTFVYTQNT